MEIKTPYGKGEKVLRIPPEVSVEFLKPHETTPMADLQAVFAQACRKPIGVPPLDELVGGGGNVVILVSDLTRSKGAEAVLPLCIEYLRELGVPPVSIQVIVARGTHRKLTKSEKAFFKKGAVAGIAVEEHDCDDPAKLSALLLTQRGTPVRVNIGLKDAGLIIILAPVSFHYFAGFGGGRKLVLPGCADRHAILANHRMSLMETKPVALHPQCRPGVLDGNPVHEDMCEAVEALQHVFGINFFTDESGRLSFLNAGDPIRSHLEACEAYEGVYRCTLERRHDVLVLSTGGYPYDINFLQSHKALRNSAGALNEGGTVLFYAECVEGIGSASLEAALSLKKKDFLKSAYEKYDLNNQTAVSLHELTEKYEIGMVSTMNVDLLLSWGIKPCVNAETFLAEALEKHNADRVGVNLNGYTLLPQLQSGGDR
ncbi:MAG: nickel-dependent lactate racemase [Candidatus Latescibacterota bacterium]|nr:MAG: nickel-dependent lactate racemase [Candidatus Latescibacterota bacterium]